MKLTINLTDAEYNDLITTLKAASAKASFFNDIDELVIEHHITMLAEAAVGGTE